LVSSPRVKEESEPLFSEVKHEITKDLGKVGDKEPVPEVSQQEQEYEKSSGKK